MVTVSVAGGGGAAPAVTVSAAFCDTPLAVATTCAARSADPVVVETVNDALEAPAATETVPGTVRTAVSVLDSETAMPPAGADWVSVIVPVDVAPPATVDGLSETALGRGPCEVSTADCVTPPPEPVMVAVRVAALAEVETGKLALKPPAVMVTDTAPFRYPYYHTLRDTPDKLDYDRLARVVKGLEGVLRDLATGGS